MRLEVENGEPHITGLGAERAVALRLSAQPLAA